MVKKNEIKFKPTNKRLFSEISSSGFTSNNSIQSASPSNNSLIPNKSRSPPNDESDGHNCKGVQIPRVTYANTNLNRLSPNFINTIVGPRPDHSSSSSPVTIVIGSSSHASHNQTSLQATTFLSSSSHLSSGAAFSAASNFSRKLQNIQSERLN